MNLKKLFDMQKKLDEKILERFPHLRNEDLLPKKILALQVELGELCNCWRGFKFWSHDQVPRTRVLVNRTTDDIGFKNIGPEHIKNPLLEEYVDCLHFLLSIGLEITEPDMINLKRWNLTKADNITEQFLWLMSDVTELYNGLCNDGFSKFEYQLLLLRFIHLGEMLGFSWEEVEEAYLQKNAENHARQERGY